MYAIFKSGGKQYKVSPGDVIRIERLSEEPGKELELTEVLAVGGEKTFLGEPTVKNAKVVVVVTNQARFPKVIVFKKKRRQGYRKLKGHRQFYTEIFVKSITSPDGETQKADDAAQVYDIDKKVKNEEKKAQLREENKQAKAPTPVAKKKATKKKVAKKAATKKKTAKKATAKKKTAKKKTAAKKATAKKATKKKTAKK